MKRLFIISFVITLLFSIAPAASAAYVEIGAGGTLTLDGSQDYSVTSLNHSFTLNPGDTQEVDFFNVTFTSKNTGSGSINATIDFESPLESVNASGSYAGKYDEDSVSGNITWDDPFIDISYGDGGLLRVVLFDMTGNSGTPLTISGSIQILAEPVPIPGAVWLLGSGLIGIVGMRRKIR